MILRPPRSTRTYPLVPYTTRFRSIGCSTSGARAGPASRCRPSSSGCLPMAGGTARKPAPALDSILAEARACRLCAAHLPLGPRPVVRAAASARLLIVGQAPGTRVHETGIPWNDRSGDRLRDRSEEHTSELQSLMRISYAVFCLKKKKTTTKIQQTQH